VLKLNEITKWQQMIGEVVNADCLQAMKLIPDKSIDICLTDPPYGIGADRAQNKASESRIKANGKTKAGRGWKQYEKTDWDNEIPKKEYFDEIFRVSKNQIIWGGNYFTGYLPPRMCWLVWDKGQREFSLADGELAWTSFDKAMRIYCVPRGRALRDGRVHPTQKSLELFKWCLEKYSQPNDLILDPFLGSGTTARACKDLGRRFIGIELEEKYCQIAEERLKQSVMNI
jgi:site-specific DNA-methyltransferase (adenine-specific)